MQMIPGTPVNLFLQGFPDEPAVDLAVSAVIHDEVASRSLGPSVRIHPTSRMVAFGRRDTHEAGYDEAVRISRKLGFTPVERLAGGRAAIFHAGIMGLSMITPEADSTVGIRERFSLMAEATVKALRSLGVDARVGEVPGEYCPGEFSVNVRGSKKLAGFSQRLIRGAAHVTGLIVIDGPVEVNAVLEPVYDALGLVFDPSATGSVVAEVGGVDHAGLARALIEAFPASLHEATLPLALVEAARARVPGLISP